MNKTVKFAIVSSWILLTRAYDAYCTYQYTPDLSYEANPLVSVLGFGWTPLLLTLVILSSYVIYAYYQATFKPYAEMLPKEQQLSFSDFVGYVYTGKKQSWTAMFYKLPNSMKRFNHVVGHLMAKSLAFAGFVSTLMWLLLNHVEAYKSIHSAKMIYAILLLGGSFIAFRWFSELYEAYKNGGNK